MKYKVSIIIGLLFVLGLVHDTALQAQQVDAGLIDQVKRLSDEQLKTVVGGTHCSNCNGGGGARPWDNDGGKQPTSEDPVDIRNGNLFYEFTDFAYPTHGGGQIALRRRYDAQVFSDLENWEPDQGTGTWVIQNGVYSGQGDRSLGKQLYTDAVIELDVRTVTPGQDSWETAWINFRFTEAAGGSSSLINVDSYYLLIHNDGRVELAKRVVGTQSPVDQAIATDSNLDPTIWNHIRIETVSNNIKVFINGAPFFDYTDANTPHTQGKIVLESHFSHCQFDNIVITDLVTPANSINDDFNEPTDNDAPFGNQWKHTYGDRLWERSNGDIVVERSNGQRHVFVFNSTTGGYDSPVLVYDTLEKLAGNDYRLTTKYGIVWNFAIDGTLSSIVDRNGNAVTLGYTNINVAVSAFVEADRALVVDNFEDSQLNLNSLNLPATDFGTMASATLVNGSIQLQWDDASDFWFSSLSKDGMATDLSAYTHFTVDLKGLQGGEQIWIALSDDTGYALAYLWLYTPVTTEFQTVRVPMSDLGNVDLTKVTAVYINCV